MSRRRSKARATSSSEQFAENADLRRPPARLHEGARPSCAPRCVDGKQEAGAKFSDYFDHVERWAGVPSHRALAMLRGRNEEVLSLDIEVDADDASPVKPVERMIAQAYAIGATAAGRQLADGGGRLDLAREAVAAAVARPDARAARAGRGRGDPCFRPQSEGSAARRTRRLARDDGARSRHPHRRQGRRRRRHRQAAGDDDGLSVPAEERSCAARRPSSPA